VRDLCIHRGVFGVGPSNADNEILPRPSLVAMATKFETKRAINRFLLEIFAKSLRLMGGFGDGLFDEGNLIPPQWRPLLSFECYMTPNGQDRDCKIFMARYLRN